MNGPRPGPVHYYGQGTANLTGGLVLCRAQAGNVFISPWEYCVSCVKCIGLLAMRELTESL